MPRLDLRLEREIIEIVRTQATDIGSRNESGTGADLPTNHKHLFAAQERGQFTRIRLRCLIENYGTERARRNCSESLVSGLLEHVVNSTFELPIGRKRPIVGGGTKQHAPEPGRTGTARHLWKFGTNSRDGHRAIDRNI